MTYVIAQGCCNDASCVSVCPVDCIRPRPGDPGFTSAEQLYIDPESCINCAACVFECPVGAIHDEWDLTPELQIFRDINAEYFEAHPLEQTPPSSSEERSLPRDRPSLRIAIVGAGPAGCYAAEELSSVAGVQVSIFDRLPTPFGLVRAGVAPDHQKTKAVTTVFEQVVSRPNVACYFNVRIGEHLSIPDILECHHAVIFAVGADADRKPGLPGEDLPGAHSAREFVSWYNGHPEHAGNRFDFSGQRALIIGNGNVALDVARVLAMPADTFTPTDMAAHAIAALRESNIREIVVAARRGAQDAAFSTSQLLALEHVAGVDVSALSAEVDAAVDAACVGADRTDAAFGVRRKVDLLREAARRAPDPAHRRITFRFLLTPVSINGTDCVSSATFRRTVDTSAGVVEETVPADLVLFATGYRGTPLSGVPFDERTGTMPNVEGRIVDAESGEPRPGMYCTGWAKRGASGVIGSNRVCSAETVGVLFDDHAAGRLPDPAGVRRSVDELVAERQPDFVRFDAWVKIDQAERERGSSVVPSRPREKFVDIKDMIAAALR